MFCAIRMDAPATAAAKNTKPITIMVSLRLVATRHFLRRVGRPCSTCVAWSESRAAARLADCPDRTRNWCSSNSHRPQPVARRRPAAVVQGRPRPGYEQDVAEPGEAEQPAHRAANTDERQGAAMSEKLEVRVDEHAQRGRVEEGHVRHVEAHVAPRASMLVFQCR